MYLDNAAWFHWAWASTWPPSSAGPLGMVFTGSVPPPKERKAGPGPGGLSTHFSLESPEPRVHNATWSCLIYSSFVQHMVTHLRTVASMMKTSSLTSEILVLKGLNYLEMKAQWLESQTQSWPSWGQGRSSPKPVTSIPRLQCLLSNCYVSGIVRNKAACLTLFLEHTQGKGVKTFLYP